MARSRRTPPSPNAQEPRRKRGRPATNTAVAPHENVVLPAGDGYQSLGEILSLMMRNPLLRSLSLGAIARVLAPAFASGQYVIGRGKNDRGAEVPVAACMWACVSIDVDERLSQNLDEPMKLAPGDWKSGDIPWLIVAVGEQLAIEPVLRELQKVTLDGRPLKMRARDQDGATAVRTLTLDGSFPLDNNSGRVVVH